MGHDMMLDQGWQTVANRVDAWIVGLDEPEELG